ncbi:hypothetical protein [Verrucomicrobium sp. BvORR106]|uniref:hypothetical protein n=1 Tax=Verrucomicrobium sp. BvORR106 TaxID=1403819 RepID=UPI000570250B|nr:hypothetical protein [Verrucomicrobium sp. BvORR106]
MKPTSIALLIWFHVVLLGAYPILGQDRSQYVDHPAALEGFRNMDAWSIAEFQLPLTVLAESRRDGKSRATPHAPPEVRLMEYFVGPLPEGTAFMYDSASWTLAVRSTNEALQRIQHFCATATEAPNILLFKLEVFESRAGADFKLHERFLAEHDHTVHVEALRKQTERGDARLVAMGQWDGKSGQRTDVVCDNPEAGTCLNVMVDPTLGPSGAVAVNLDFEQLAASSSKPKLSEARAEAKITTSVTVQCGRPRVIGMWKPRGSAKDVTRTAVLTVDAVPLLPEKNPQMAERLRASLGLTGGAEIAKTSSPQEIIVPPGMVLRQIDFPINPYLLWQDRNVQGGMVMDPFAAESAVENPEFTGSLKEILKQQGINLSTESKVYYHRQTTTLVVLCDPEIIDQIQGFLDGIMFHPPTVLRTELQIVEGEAAQIGSLVAATEGLTDHTTAWRLLESLVVKGDVRQTGLLITETRSGQKMAMFAGESMRDDPQSDAQDEEDRDGPPGIGTRLVLDPVMGPDGYSIDVNMTLTHHGLFPLENGKQLSPPHFIKTSFETATGKPVLFGVWSSGKNSASGKSNLQAAFLKVHYVRVVN